MSGYARDKDGSRRPVEIPRNAIGISHSDGAYSRGKITSRRTHLAKPPEPPPEQDDTEDEETP